MRSPSMSAPTGASSRPSISRNRAASSRRSSPRVPRCGPILRRQLRFGTAHRAFVDRLILVLEDRSKGAGHRPALPEALTDREAAVLRYLPTMMSNHEIASELFLSVNTVKTHLRSIYRKLGVADRREAVLRAREVQLLAPHPLRHG